MLSRIERRTSLGGTSSANSLSRLYVDRSRSKRFSVISASLPDDSKRNGQAVALPAHIYHYVEKSQETVRSIYLRALPGPLKWAPSFLVPLSASLAVIGSVNAHHLLEYLHRLEIPDWLPVASELQYHYGQHANLANLGVDTLAASFGALFIFLALPAMDLILGQDPGIGKKDTKTEPIFKGMLHAHVIIYWLVIGSAVWTCGNSDMHPLTILTLAVSLALAGDMSFIASHELLHSPQKRDKFMASMGLMPLAYMHWVPSHIAHHRKVATMDDPTTARLDETLYRYLPRTIYGNLKDGIDVELARLKARSLSGLHPQNRIFQWFLGPIGLIAGIYTLWGPKAACLGILQAIIADVLLETVNYVEHYGLERKQGLNGQHERVSIHHSWNANWLFTNSIMMSVQRHSDHHAHAYKPYQELQDLRSAPQLPASYPVMMILAFLPGLFFDVMNPRVNATRED